MIHLKSKIFGLVQIVKVTAVCFQNFNSYEQDRAGSGVHIDTSIGIVLSSAQGFFTPVSKASFFLSNVCPMSERTIKNLGRSVLRLVSERERSAARMSMLELSEFLVYFYFH